MAAALERTMTDLPYVTDDLPGIGGAIKAEQDHFQVVEHLPYAPCGEGEHLYLTLKRSGWNTADVARSLMQRLNLRPQDVGWGGRKDRQAICTQTFSLCLPLTEPDESVLERLSDLPFDILECRRHRNKIKTGHVAANSFRILLSGVSEDSLDQALALAERLKTSGVPNFYGPQRFGINMNNIAKAVDLLDHPKSARGTKGAFMVSVLQSALFNQWLARRMTDGQFNTILKGDVVRKTDTGGMFVVDDAAEAQERLDNGAIVNTGPIYGFKMKQADFEAASGEACILKEYELQLSDFKALRAPGTRRDAQLRIPDISIETVNDGLWFNFTLPSGAFATTLMREFMRRTER